jgi:hypothetical protein
MVFFRDEGSRFRAPRDVVWEFVGSGERHASAHHHRGVRRGSLPGNRGEYAWEQEFEGRSERFSMRWTSLHPFGLAYEVLEGPLRGSKFLLYYRALGAETEVGVLGEFVSPTIPEEGIEPAVRRFFEREYEQDRAEIEAPSLT